MHCLYTISTHPTQYSFYDRVSIVSVAMMVVTSVASVDTPILLLLTLTVPTKVTLVAYDNKIRHKTWLQKKRDTTEKRIEC